MSADELPEGWQRCNDQQSKGLVENMIDEIMSADDDPVNPSHYRRGPVIEVGPCDTYGVLIGHSRPTMELDGRLHIMLEAIDVMRCISDPRLATAFRYLWRVAFGGKEFLEEGQTQEAKNVQDIKKTIWYLSDWINNQPKVM